MAIARARRSNGAIEPHATQLAAVDALREQQDVEDADVVRVREITGSVEVIVDVRLNNGHGYQALISPSGRVYPLDANTRTPDQASAA